MLASEEGTPVLSVSQPLCLMPHPHFLFILLLSVPPTVGVQALSFLSLPWWDPLHCSLSRAGWSELAYFVWLVVKASCNLCDINHLNGKPSDRIVITILSYCCKVKLSAHEAGSSFGPRFVFSTSRWSFVSQLRLWWTFWAIFSPSLVIPSYSSLFTHFLISSVPF